MLDELLEEELVELELELLDELEFDCELCFSSYFLRSSLRLLAHSGFSF